MSIFISLMSASGITSLICNLSVGELIISFGGALLVYDAWFNDFPKLIEQLDKHKHTPGLLKYINDRIQSVKSLSNK